MVVLHVKGRRQRSQLAAHHLVRQPLRVRADRGRVVIRPGDHVFALVYQGIRLICGIPGEAEILVSGPGIAGERARQSACSGLPLVEKRLRRGVILRVQRISRIAVLVGSRLCVIRGTKGIILVHHRTGLRLLPGRDVIRLLLGCNLVRVLHRRDFR